MKPTRKNILIVEDDTKVARAMSARLQAHGYSVSTALNGVNGAHLAQSNPPDLIIADIFMPIGAGFAMAYRLREAACNTPIIFMTGSTNPELKNSARRFGAVDFIEKPYEAERLVQAVAKALASGAVAKRLISVAITRHRTGDPKRILVVEDDRKIALSLSIRLQAAHYEVSLAYDALTGANLAQGENPHLIILDITMPGGGGFKVAEQVRKVLPKETPIVFITASKQPRLRQRALDLGAAGYFEKPYDAEALLATIRHALGEPTSNGRANHSG